MDLKLKEFLRSKGISEETINKIEQGDAPDDPIARLRKLDPTSPVLAKIKEVNELLNGLNGIRDTLAEILKADAYRAAGERGADLFNKGLANGFKQDVLDIPRFLKEGLQR